MARAKKAGKANANEPLGFEQKLWAAADKMRGHMDPAEYKHVALGLIFLKYISYAVFCLKKKKKKKKDTVYRSLLAPNRTGNLSVCHRDHTGLAVLYNT